MPESDEPRWLCIETIRCARCDASATWFFAVGNRETPYCWRHDADGDVDPVRAAWRRFNDVNNEIMDALNGGEEMRPQAFLERDNAKRAIEDAIRAQVVADLADGALPERRSDGGGE